jgi:RES domain-containing protein
MRLWRLSSARRARDFSGGYGLLNSGRWNPQGHPVTYCSTVPSLAALPKRTDPGLLPPQALVEYDAPDDISLRAINIKDLPGEWAARETYTQKLGSDWLEAGSEVIFIIPSAIVPIASAPDRNVMINHRHVEVARINIIDILPFTLDPRLFKP